MSAVNLTYFLYKILFVYVEMPRTKIQRQFLQMILPNICGKRV